MAQSSYVLKYSPVSAWLKITTAVGYNSLVWSVPLAATPNPNGKSLRLYIHTGAYCGIFYVILAICALITWLPYKNGI